MHDMGFAVFCRYQYHGGVYSEDMGLAVSLRGAEQAESEVKEVGLAVDQSGSFDTGKLLTLSEQQLVDCATVDSACNGGLMDNVFAFVEKNAMCTEDQPQYTETKGTCSDSRCTVGLSRNCHRIQDVTVNSVLSALGERRRIWVIFGFFVWELWKTHIFSVCCRGLGVAGTPGV